MIRIALCDDEAKILDEVSERIKEYSEKKNNPNIEVCCFESASSLIHALNFESTFDIFLLDIYIGDEMGTALAKTIRKRGIESPIVFLTTSLEHAPQSLETGTLRYLIKPLNLKKFYEAMDAAIVGAEKVFARFISLKTEDGLTRVNVNHVMYSESQSHYQYVALENGETLKVRMTVHELYETLMKTGGFVRMGSSYIINLRNVKNISTTELRLYNDIRLSIPRGKHLEIKEAFWAFQSEGQEE